MYPIMQTENLVYLGQTIGSLKFGCILMEESNLYALINKGKNRIKKTEFENRELKRKRYQKYTQKNLLKLLKIINTSL